MYIPGADEWNKHYGLGEFAPGAAGGTGTLTGAPGTGGSPAAGRIPGVPDPTATATSAITGNISNLPGLEKLFQGIGGTMVPNYPALSATQSGNIASLLGSPDPRATPGAYGDEFRHAAETGAGLGIGGSAAEGAMGYRMSDRERIARQAQGTSMLSAALGQANQVLPLQNFQTTPQQSQEWQYMANLMKAAPDPELAWQRAMQLAREGINRGYGAGYGAGGGASAPRSAGPAPAQSIGYAPPPVYRAPGPVTDATPWERSPIDIGDVNLGGSLSGQLTPENWGALTNQQQQDYLAQLMQASYTPEGTYE